MSSEQAGASPRRPFRNLKNHGPAIVAVCIATVLATTVPALARAAYDAVNADKVDGKHAVAATTNATARKGKLVATDSQGFLPDNITKKAVGYAEENPRIQTVLQTAGSVALVSTTLTVKDECGGGKTRHRYIVTGSSWTGLPTGGDGTGRMQVSLSPAIAYIPGLAIATMAPGGLSQLTSQRRIVVAPGARTFSVLADSTFSVGTSMEFGDATITVADAGYFCLATSSTSQGAEPRTRGDGPTD